MVDLVGTQQRAVDLAHHLGHRVRRVQRLVRIHLTGEVGVAGDLPARQVDGTQPRLHLLHGLVAGQRAERVDERGRVHVAPQALGATPGQRVLDTDGAAQARHVGGRVATLDARPARVRGPVLLELSNRKRSHRHSLGSQPAGGSW